LHFSKKNIAKFKNIKYLNQKLTSSFLCRHAAFVFVFEISGFAVAASFAAQLAVVGYVGDVEDLVRATLGRLVNFLNDWLEELASKLTDQAVLDEGVFVDESMHAGSDNFWLWVKICRMNAFCGVFYW
jgi:hypothetical protein